MFSGSQKFSSKWIHKLWLSQQLISFVRTFKISCPSQSQNKKRDLQSKTSHRHSEVFIRICFLIDQKRNTQYTYYRLEQYETQQFEGDILIYQVNTSDDSE